MASKMTAKISFLKILNVLPYMYAVYIFELRLDLTPILYNQNDEVVTSLSIDRNQDGIKMFTRYRFPTIELVIFTDPKVNVCLHFDQILKGS